MINIRIVLLILCLTIQISFTKAENKDFFVEDKIIIVTKKNNYIFNIEIADNDFLRSYGLMNRNSLDKSNGMLFIYPNVKEVSMWMKDTLIPLDIIFIKQDGIISKIMHNAKPLDKSLINSEGEVLAVLELNGGLTKLLNIKVGDKIIYKLFK